MEQKLMKHIDLLMERYPVLECCKNDIIDAFDLLDDTYSKEGKMLICGNGGSAADAEHMVGELMKGFKISRKLLSNEVDKDSKLSALADTCIQVPETETYMVQELHLPVYHCLCLMLEEKFFG